jgi:hypothetical protein
MPFYFEAILTTGVGQRLSKLENSFAGVNPNRRVERLTIGAVNSID